MVLVQGTSGYDPRRFLAIRGTRPLKISRLPPWPVAIQPSHKSALVGDGSDLLAECTDMSCG
jgi:hypothetical protein